MAYTVYNYQTKKEVVEEFKKRGQHIMVFHPGRIGTGVEDGHTFIEGPHYPAPQTWFLYVDVKNGEVIKIHNP